MKELRFETGLVSYSINGAYELTFNPTDFAFSEQIFSAFDALDSKQEAYKARIEGIKDTREMFQTARDLDAEMRGIIDGILGEGVSAAVFGDLNCYAMGDGFPIWANLMLTIVDEIERASNEQHKLLDPRIKKYQSKYRK